MFYEAATCSLCAARHTRLAPGMHRGHALACPRCGSFKTRQTRYVNIGGGALLAVCSVWWVVVIVGIFPLLIGLGMIVYGLTVPRERMRCRTCKTDWQTGESEAEGRIDDGE